MIGKRMEFSESGIHSLQNDRNVQNTVARCVFEFLSIGDLKNCRQVCQVWKREADYFFRKRSMIVFGSSKYSDVAVRSPHNFLESFDFFSSSATNLPFTSFCFENTEWSAYILRNFFLEQRNNVKELELQSIKMINFDYTFVKYFDITSWITVLPFLSKLEINCCNSGGSSSRLILSLHLLTSIKNLKLQECRVIATKQNRIAPTSISLFDVMFIKDGRILSNYLLNELIDFRNAKDISIFHDDFTFPIIDLNQNFSANMVTLYNVKVLNWQTSKSSVEVLTMKKTPFLKETTMKIRELRFEGSYIHLRALPPSLEKLYLWSDGSIILSFEDVILPNLTFVMIQGQKWYVLSYFSKCTNLVTIDINCCIENTSLRWQILPKSVKRLKLKGIKVIEHNRRINLQLFVLDSYSLLEAANILSRITPEVLVLKRGKEEFVANDSLLLFLKRFNDIIVYVGPLFWDEDMDSFLTSRMMNYVDKQSAYYVFENGKGSSIDKKCFDLMVNLG